MSKRKSNKQVKAILNKVCAKVSSHTDEVSWLNYVSIKASGGVISRQTYVGDLYHPSITEKLSAFTH